VTARCDKHPLEAAHADLVAFLEINRRGTCPQGSAAGRSHQGTNPRGTETQISKRGVILIEVAGVLVFGEVLLAAALAAED
jgi:hypothetical protein